MNRCTKAKLPCFVKGLVAFFALSFSIYFTTCDMPMGLGDPIDWEPPVLTMDPEPNPKYVRLGTKISGTVTDNIGVDRVIMRNAETGEEMFKATITGDRWEIALEFTEEQNGLKIMAEVVGFDKRGNSGDSSIKAITLVVDIGPPLIEDIWIQRTIIERAYLETYNEITSLENTDPNGERSANMNRYQNGYFTIMGKVKEDETRIEIISLNISDTRHPDTTLLSIPLKEGISAFNPSWLVKEEDILAAGDSKIDPNYSSKYYNDNARYYYRVTLIALDRSENESRTIVEDEGYFCMWQKADEPKGILDPVMSSAKGSKANPVVVTKGSTLPVEFFDDDQLLWAYTGLLTLEQWNGEKTDPNTGAVTGPAYIYTGNVKIEGSNDREKLEFLRNRIVRDGDDVYNWEFDRKVSFVPTAKNTIGNEITGQINSKIIYVQTGADDTDNGEYVLFTLTSDTKLDPHTNTGPKDTDKPRETYRIWHVNVIDENEPIIVFDTVVTSGGSYVPSVHPGGSVLELKGGAYRTGNSPEDNTFPSLDIATGRYFEINGYTLRANRSGTDEVKKFRMAWIPYGIGTGDNSADSYISRVQTALSSLSYPASMSALEAQGIQHWDFVVTDNAANPDIYENGKLLKGTEQKMDDDPDSTDKFTKQVFRKRFDVLGGPDDLKPSYYNFRTSAPSSNPLVGLENDIKLFVFYAEDSMGHIVYRQLRLLGNKKPPTLTVYDITDRILTFAYGPSNGLPDLTNKVEPSTSPDKENYYFYNGPTIDEEGRGRYYATLQAYQQTAYGIINTSIIGKDVEDANKTEVYTPYTLDTELKYWVTASRSGDLFVNDIKMFDITSNIGRREVGWIDPLTKKGLSYVEKLPEVTMRVFLFEASDTLGNKAEIQRTVAITNAARLENITTSTQSGTYGIGTKITIQANYSNLVKWTGTAPQLNVRYFEGGGYDDSGNLIAGTQVLRRVTTSTPVNTPSLSLDFDFTVNENFYGALQTMYIDVDGGSGLQGNATNQRDRPIYLPTGTRILDATRGDDAFTPGYSAAFEWTHSGDADDKSLQGPKTIILDGIRPRITGFEFNPPTGKETPFADANPGFFLKSDDTIQFTLTANKNIFTSGSPVIQFQVGNNATYRSAAWQRSASAKGMVFSVIINNANIPAPTDGSVSNIRLADVSTIVDAYGNAFATGTGAFSTNITIPNTIHIDRTPPIAPITSVGGFTVPLSNSKGNNYFNTTPNVTMDISISGDPTGAQTREYSLNNGVLWQSYTVGGNAIQPNGRHMVATRYTDRAGNVGGITTQEVEVNATFPKLLAITPVQSNGWYRSGTLSFNLDFEEPVNIPSGNSISITLRDRSTAATTNVNTVTATRAGPVNTATQSNTVQVSFNIANTHDMRHGLYVSAVNFTGLRDRFGNSGATGTATYTAPDETGTAGVITISGQTTNNLAAGLKVDAVAPAFVNTNPTNPAVGGVSQYPTPLDTNAPDKRNVITITFNEPVEKGTGLITIQPSIRPNNEFLVPPVFEDAGYYIDCVTEAPASASSNRTIWIPGFYDIYNSGLTAAQRNALTSSTTEASQRAVASAGTVPSSIEDTGTPSMTRLRLDARTGQPVGPYVKTTHGLKAGYGYSGNYSGNRAATEVFGPNTEAGFTTDYPLFEAMVPDTSTKWVLRYNLPINSTDAAITGIRNALRAAKFRQQEIDVGWDNVTIGAPAANGATTVSIRVNEPLLQGLEWDLSYASGTFNDQAGNPAEALPVNSYYFWSEGVRKPVIRVDRKSYDARNSNHHAPRTGANDSSSFTYAAPASGEWAIGAFENIAYRIETETRGATITYGVTGRNNSTTGNGSAPYNAVTVNAGTTTVTADNGTTNNNGIAGTIWNGPVANAVIATNWDSESANRNTFWVLPNLLRKFGRSGNYTDRSAQIVNGDQRRSSGWLSVLHSYNADATSAILDATINASNFPGAYGTNAASPVNGTVNFGALEAGKSYIVATADRSTYTSGRGYEGVFRTLLVLNGQKGNRAYTNGTGTGAIQTNAAGINKILVGGSNIKAGTPSIPGFPLLDGAENGDARFVKMMFNVDNDTNTTNTGKRFYWVSTEIVCEFYMAYFGNGGNTQRTGDVNNYVMVNYGDLTYAFKLDRFPDAN